MKAGSPEKSKPRTLLQDPFGEWHCGSTSTSPHIAGGFFVGRLGRALSFLAVGFAFILGGTLMTPRLDTCKAHAEFLFCSGNQQPHNRHFRFASLTLVTRGGETRKYVLSRPDPSKAGPTMVVLHGVYGNGVRTASESGLGEFAFQRGYVSVFPSAPNGFWNAFPDGKVPESVKRRAGYAGIGNDVAFLGELVKQLVRQGITDPQKVYLVGISMGGCMACVDSDDFAGVALIASSMPDATGDDCRPANPISLLMIHGEADRVVPYAGGMLPDADYSVWATERTLAFFRLVDGCSNDREEFVVPTPTNRRKPHVRVSKWNKCNSARLAFYFIKNGTHKFPPRGFNVGSALVEFFEHPLRSCVHGGGRDFC